MRKVTVSVVVGFVLTWLFFGSASSVLAGGDGGGTGPGGGIVGGSPEAVVVMGRSGPIASWSSSGGGRGPTLTCAYYEWGGGLPVLVGGIGAPTDPVPGREHLFGCVDASGQMVHSRLVVYDPGDPFAGVAAAERALDEARRRLDLPLPEPALNPPGAQLVGVATWLWVDGPWQALEATASVGAVSSTVTARPVEAVWSMGDGTTLTCGAGTPYDPTRDARDQDSGCTHVFSRSSSGRPGGSYPVTVTVTYEVGWSASTGVGGTLGTLTRSTSAAVVVQQAQAVIR